MRSHVLTLDTPLPPKELVLKSSKTKLQLIDIICDSLLHHSTTKRCSNPLFVTGQSDVPSSTCKGVRQTREDMRTTHEEADVIIPQQVDYALHEGYKNIRVLCDDTDVFVLLVYYHHIRKWQNDVLLLSLDSTNNKPISIRLTAEKHKSLVSSLPAVHALSGCDTVPSMCGIGKTGAIKVVKENVHLLSLGNLTSPISEVVSEAKSFVSRCYGFKDCEDMSEMRFQILFHFFLKL